MKLSLHKVGNKGENENLSLSKNLLSLSEDLMGMLESFFLSAFKPEEYFYLYHDTSLELNEVFSYTSAIFKDPECLQEQSVNLAKHLYNKSTHPKIKAGEFYVAYFTDCAINGEIVDAVGLFKSENKDTFLQIKQEGENFAIESLEGINIKKIDKGCLIYNLNAEDGFLVSVVDNINKGSEAQYWMDDFLSVRQCQDKFFNTENTLSLYKDYILKKLPDEYEISKADQADFLNRSMTFFKEKENFEIAEFQDEVLQQSEIIDSFNRYKEHYQHERAIEISDSFPISESAVKRQSRSYKSIIKLDKNFHIYIHGDKRMIEQGEDDQGKFYKLYFKEES